MATGPERMRALRERTRRGIRMLTIDVSQDDLRTLAERGYEGAASIDADQQAQAVGLFLNDSLPVGRYLYDKVFRVGRLSHESGGG